MTDYASYRDVRRINRDLKSLRKVRRLMVAGHDVTPEKDVDSRFNVHIPKPRGNAIKFERVNTATEVAACIDSLQKSNRLESFDPLLEKVEYKRCEVISLFMSCRLERALLNESALLHSLEDDLSYCEISSDLKQALKTAYNVSQPLSYLQFVTRKRDDVYMVNTLLEMFLRTDAERAKKIAFCALKIANKRHPAQDIFDEYVRLATEACTADSSDAVQALELILRVMTANHRVRVMERRRRANKERGQKPNACVLNAIKSAINHFSLKADTV